MFEHDAAQDDKLQHLALLSTSYSKHFATARLNLLVMNS
jgi:hypothetical protein